MYRRFLPLSAGAVPVRAPLMLWTASGASGALRPALTAPRLTCLSRMSMMTSCTPARGYAAANPGSSGGAGSAGGGSGTGSGGGAGSGSASASAAANSAAAKKKKKLLLSRAKSKAGSGKSASSTSASGGSGGGSAAAGAASSSSGGHGASGSGGHASSSAASGAGAAASSAPAKKNKVASERKRKLALKKRKRPSAAGGSTTAGSGSGSAGGTGSAASASATPAARKTVKTVKKAKKAKKTKAVAKKVPASASSRLRRTGGKRIRICVLNSSYAGINSETAAVDNYLCTPQHYAKKDKQRYTFTDVSVEKNDSYRTVRELVTSGKYDLFFNLCDGAKDERRAGVDVVHALEEMNAAFTGADSHSFEPSKIDMKLLVGSSGVRVPNFVLLENTDGLAKKCRHLRFPVIVKHLSGYASVGIHKDNRCDNLEQLKSKVISFIKKYNHALVEEFIRGAEGTVLACADAHSPHGVKVFRPLMFKFLQGADDFAYFDKKWAFECTEEAYAFLPASDPSYEAIIAMARNAYKYIMNGVGYGRVDFRIDEKTNKPYFLEINPNCGMWYSEKDGGDFADIMVQGDSTWNHERFVANAISHAMREQSERKPWYFISHDKNGQFSTRASKTVPAGKCLFGDAIHPTPVISKALFKLGAEEPTVGCVICRADGVHQAVAVRHSCAPNMAFVHGRTLLFAANRQISVGEELTVDYSTLRDESMPPFACTCGTEKCRSMIFPMPASSRTVEGRGVKKILLEQKRLWMQERKADKEAETILRKRSHKVTASASNSSAASSSSSAAATGASK